MSCCFATGLSDEPWSCHSHRTTWAAPADDAILRRVWGQCMPVVTRYCYDFDSAFMKENHFRYSSHIFSYCGYHSLERSCPQFKHWAENDLKHCKVPVFLRSCCSDVLFSNSCTFDIWRTGDSQWLKIGPKGKLCYFCGIHAVLVYHGVAAN